MSNNYLNLLNKLESNSISHELLILLPEIARKLIVNRPENNNFLINPDDPLDHEPNWHQFGIITHTGYFYNIYRNILNELLDNWGLSNKINEKLREQIDNKPKSELLQISCILHDIGKFSRGFKDKEGKISPDYKGHELKSAQIILENMQINKYLIDILGLTNNQIKYISDSAGLHYELGKARDKAYLSLGYSIAYLSKEEFRNSCFEIINKHLDFKIEIGLLYLCDSLAKTNIWIDAVTDDEIQNKTQEIRDKINEKNLNTNLIAAIKQLPVNVGVAKRYLELLTTH